MKHICTALNRTSIICGAVIFMFNTYFKSAVRFGNFFFTWITYCHFLTSSYVIFYCLYLLTCTFLLLSLFRFLRFFLGFPDLVFPVKWFKLCPGICYSFRIENNFRIFYNLLISTAMLKYWWKEIACMDNIYSELEILF